MNEISNENGEIKIEIEGEQEDILENRVFQTLNYGNVYEAVFSGFIKTTDVLKYLLTNEINDETPKQTRLRLLTAYRIVCVLDKSQQIDGKHFIELNNNEMYLAIFVLSYYTHQTLLQTNFNLSHQTIEKIHRIYFRLFVEHKFTSILYYICDLNYEHEKFDEDNIDNLINIVDARSLRYISKYKDLLSGLSIPFIYTDYLEPLEGVEQTWDEIGEYVLTRCLVLIKNAPLYWKHVAEPLFRKTVIKNIDVDYPKMDKHVIQLWETIFPRLFPQNVLNSSTLKLKLNKLFGKIRYYVLGFPIHIYTPSSKEVDLAIAKLEELGIEKYCDWRIELNRKYISYNLIECEKSNNEDTLFEHVENYNPIDVISYFSLEADKKHLFLFTRPEFENLLREKKNPYTQSPLPVLVLEKIKFRNCLVDNFHLPKSSTIEELLIKVKEGKPLFEMKRTTFPPLPNRSAPSLEESDDNIFVEYYDPGLQTYGVRIVNGISNIPESTLENVISSLFLNDGLDYIRILDEDEIIEELEENPTHHVYRVERSRDMDSSSE